MKALRTFEPHLVIREITVPRSAEWVPRLRGWSFVQVRSGIGYWRVPGRVEELSTGASLLITREAHGVLRASQLSDVVLVYACLEPDRLPGMLSLGEQQALRGAAASEQFASRTLPASDPLSLRFAALSQGRSVGADNFFLRVQLVLFFGDCFGPVLREPTAHATPSPDGRGRLRQLLRQMVASDLMEASLADLAPRMNCSPRHLSRLFRAEVGMSFQEKQTELRLARACQLLTTTNAKVIDVGVASGYQSNSLFSLMFKKHFGVSPGKWRQQHNKKQPGRQKIVRMLSA
jgi:AraC-like DNA-binding protein